MVCCSSSDCTQKHTDLRVPQQQDRMLKLEFADFYHFKNLNIEAVVFIKH